MLVVFGQIPINDVLIGRITKSEWRSRVYSLRYIVTFSVMASTLPVIAGIHAGWGIRGALFVVMAIAASAIFTARPDAAAHRLQPRSDPDPGRCSDPARRGHLRLTHDHSLCCTLNAARSPVAPIT